MLLTSHLLVESVEKYYVWISIFHTLAVNSVCIVLPHPSYLLIALFYFAGLPFLFQQLGKSTEKNLQYLYGLIKSLAHSIFIIQLEKWMH